MIYTRTGDLGETGLSSGPRVGKDHFRIEAIGSLDELTAALGLVRSQIHAALLPAHVELDRTDELGETGKLDETAELDKILAQIQCDLHVIIVELSSVAPKREKLRQIDDLDVQRLESEIDKRFDQEKPAIEPTLPGLSALEANLNWSRVLARRAERRIVTAVRKAPAGEIINPRLLAYMNRLSDLLYVLERTQSPD